MLLDYLDIRMSYVDEKRKYKEALVVQSNHYDLSSYTLTILQL